MGALANAHLDGHGLKVTQFIYATVKFALCYRYANPRSPSLPRIQILKLKFNSFMPQLNLLCVIDTLTPDLRHYLAHK
jgi:hypothetical protein